MPIVLSAAEMASIQSGYDPVASRSWSINARCYTDPKFQTIEREQIFHKSWQFLCHEEKLREPGSYVAASIEGQSIVATRDTSGELRAFYNVCKHRGHELVKGEGQLKRLTCPYHAWTYELDGSLKAAQRSDKIENFNKSEVCLDQVQIETFCHLIFVNLDPQATPLAEQSGELAQEVVRDDVLQPEDIGLVESVQRGMQTPAFQQGHYMVDPEGSGLSEHAVHHFHGLVLAAYAQAVEENSMNPTSINKRALIEGCPALVVIDIQAETFHDRTDEAIPTMPDYPERMLKARHLIDKARQQNIPVIFIQEVHRPDLVDFGRELDGSEDVHCIETAPGTEIAKEEMGFRENDYLIKKRRCSAFFGTDFEILLRGLRVDTLLLCGGLTDVCVHYTFVDGHQSDYFCRVVEDCVAGSGLEAHEASLRAMEYLQTGARCSLESVLEAMSNYS